MKRVKRSRWCLALILCAPIASAQDSDDLARARFLDQQGVRAFAESRFRDAMTLFSESYRAGGPPSELWNMARCQLKLDDTPGARRTLERYLAHKDLSADDRGEAQRLLDEIERRPSTFVVASTPAGAVVLVDGRSYGVTPLASTLPPGGHDVSIESDDEKTTLHVDARDGRAVVVSIALGAHGKHRTHHARAHDRRFSAELGALATVSSLGGAAVVGVAPAPELSVVWAPFVLHRVRIGFGVRFGAGFDSWSTSAGVSNAIAGCTPPNDYSGAEILATPAVFASYRTSKRVSIGARAGFGAAIYVAGAPIGGDLFAPSCPYGGSLAPDGYAAIDVSVRLSDLFRVVFLPASLDIHPAYVGARSDASLDASQPWIRVSTGVAVAVDL